MSEKHAETVQVIIDGVPVTASKDETIVQVARRTGCATIPTLCYSPLLPPYGSCFVCVVEVEGARTLQPACATRVREGMVVRTDTPRVRETRRMALELLLSTHWADCLGPCQMGCPAGVDAQGYLALAREGRFAEAVALIKRVNPLPIVCGRVCVRACEVVCERRKVDEPVGINFVKRYAAELERGEVFVPTPAPGWGKRVAIVGSGPAGLTCAYYLALEGVSCTIYDAWPKPGGMLRYGIPEYRLPKHLLDLEIGTITRLGVEIKTGVRLGRDVSLASLRAEYDAVFIAVGAPVGQRMRVEGEDTTDGVLPGLDFLTRILLGNPLQVHGRVVVVGGGNTAIDAARTAFRLGADEVIILYRRTRAEMPADPVEIHAAEEEGVRLEFLAAPTAIVSEDGKLKGIKAIRMELGEPDASGRRRPVPIPGSEFFLPCDFVFGAIGQTTDLSWARGEDDAAGLARTKWDTLVVDEKTMQTNIPGVFSGGDVVSGPSVVIEAIAHGRRAALAMLSYLRTGTAQAPPKPFYSTRERLLPTTPEDLSFHPKRPRSRMPEAPPEERKRTWDETELGLDADAVRYETDRCLVCGCLDLGDCELQKLATEYGADPTVFKGEVIKHRPDESHPFIILDNNKCILCGKCVALCRDLIGPAALGFVTRGFTTTVKPTLEVPLRDSPCIGCGNCIDQCPTGALMEHMRTRKLREWKVEYHSTVCGHCAVGCPLRFATVVEGVRWVQTPSEVSEPSRGLLCQAGRFGHGYLSSPQRLTNPLVREHGHLRPASWDEALARAASVLRAAAGEVGGVAVVGSATLTLEEAYLLQRLGRGPLQAALVATGGQIWGTSCDRALDELVGYTASTVPLSTIDTADALVVAAEPFRQAPTVDFRVHQAIQRGAKVVYVGPTPEGSCANASVKLITSRPALALLLVLRSLALQGGLSRPFLRARAAGADRLDYQLRSLDEESLLRTAGVDPRAVEHAVSLLRESGTLVGIGGVSASLVPSCQALTLLLLGLGKLGVEGSGLLILRTEANEQGMPVVGLHPEFLPGRMVTPSAQEPRAVLASARAALVVGEDPLAQLPREALPPLLVVADVRATATAAAAEVVLPIGAPAEARGHWINLERRLVSLQPLCAPPSGLATWEVVARLEAMLDGHGRVPSWDELACEVARLFGPACAIQEGVIPLFTERFMTASGLAEVGRPDVLRRITEGAPSATETATVRAWVKELISGPLA